MPLKTTSSVSVIMPTYNGARFLVETVESLEKQTHPISELVISDDSSNDETLELALNFAKSASFKVNVVEHIPSGVTANYLNALQYTTGDIVCVADQDDVWLPNKAELVVQAFQQEGVSLVCHDCLLVDVKLKSLGRTLRGDVGKSVELSRLINSYDDSNNLLRFLKGGLPLLAHSLAFKKELKQLLLSKPAAISSWWFEEWLSCIALTQGRLHFVAEQLVQYRQHDSQTSGGFEQAKKYSNQLGPITTNSKYSDRIQKMKCCVTVSKNDSGFQRQNIFADYVLFLQQRDQTLETRLSIKSFLVNIGLLLRGRYHRYSNGIKSFGLDLLIQIRNFNKA